MADAARLYGQHKRLHAGDQSPAFYSRAGALSSNESASLVAATGGHGLASASFGEPSRYRTPALA